MTQEQVFFIQVLSDYLKGRKTSEVSGVDWEEVLYYAQKHQVSGMVYVQVKSFAPKEILDTLQKETISAFIVCSRREEDIDIIRKSFWQASIPFFIIKGPGVAGLYPEPQLRTMGDIDLVVRPEDREMCHEILVRNGFRPATKQRDREWQYFRNNLETELHDRLVYKEAVNRKGQDLFFNNCWEYVENGEINPDFHLLYLIFHLRKHLMNSGAGFRQFMDLAVFAQHGSVDWKWMKDHLEQTGMYDFAKRCYGFIYCWFGIQTPLTEEIDQEFFEIATQKIFADGIFGTDNAENEDSDVINRVRNKSFPKIRMIQTALIHIFPSKNTLECIEPYRYLQKYPILLPAAWIQRMIRGKTKKKEKIILEDIKKSFTSKERISRRNDMLQKWGL